MPEIDSFFFKFKSLLRSQKNATLTLKTDSGKVSVNLSLEFENTLGSPPRRNACGPGRQCHRERRAAARETAENKIADGNDDQAEEAYKSPGDDGAAATEAESASENASAQAEKITEPSPGYAGVSLSLAKTELNALWVA